ncbi:alkene reductase [Sphingomonas nostoxanthinifaciens]|uniref:alkene reductase n=1 Tax=Sphingomonas nostoxanthinifaciens TaxID=2872652 RepID=UPI001CC1D4A6|nr:alkene reductase [Sphingomonas nostoxanthinifaciens]UAK24836.1 alkene reductase [Sphingomonas nostoxanthinifaciens]
MPRLTDPIVLGSIHAKNRMVMSPLTRGRATREAVPTPIMADYYRQRASAGLIITEATGISRLALGWPYAPGLWTEAQVAGWQPATQAVHEAGGRIVTQLWHMGRLGHESVMGAQPVSSSATTAPGHAHTYEGNQPYPQARALDADEIPGILDDYARAAENALRAGFDGIQLHAANGYLIDQFLRDNANFRTDQYGGPVENRIRLLGEVTTRLVETIGKDHVGVRLSPNETVQGVHDSDPHSLFGAAAKLLDEVGVAWIELREPRPGGTRGAPEFPPVHPVMRKAFSRPLILNSDYDAESGQAALDAGEADAIAFGRTFIANPDLPRRLIEGLPLNEPQFDTFYTQGAEGYVDYPTWEQVQAAA